MGFFQGPHAAWSASCRSACLTTCPVSSLRARCIAKYCCGIAARGFVLPHGVPGLVWCQVKPGGRGGPGCVLCVKPERRVSCLAVSVRLIWWSGGNADAEFGSRAVLPRSHLAALTGFIVHMLESIMLESPQSCSRCLLLVIHRRCCPHKAVPGSSKAVAAHAASNTWLCHHLVAEPAHLSSDCNRVCSTNAESLMVCMRQRPEDVERGRQDRCNVMCLRLQSLPSRLPGLHTACYRTQEQVSLLAFPQQLTLSIKCCNLTSVRVDVRRTLRMAGRGGRTGSPERHRCSPGACQLPLAAWCAAQQRSLASLLFMVGSQAARTASGLGRLSAVRITEQITRSPRRAVRDEAHTRGRKSEGQLCVLVGSAQDTATQHAERSQRGCWWERWRCHGCLPASSPPRRACAPRPVRRAVSLLHPAWRKYHC